MGITECVKCKNKINSLYSENVDNNIRIVKYINLLESIGNVYMIHNEDNSLLTFSNDMNIRILKYDIFQDDYYIDNLLPNPNPLSLISAVCLLDNNTLLIGYETGEIKSFDLDEKICVFSGYFHKSKIKKILCLYFDEFITISDEPYIKVWSQSDLSLRREYSQDSFVNDLLLLNNYIGITAGNNKDIYIWNFQINGNGKKIELQFNVKNMCYIENEVILVGDNSICKLNIGNYSISQVININNEITKILPLCDKSLIIVINKSLLHLNSNYEIIGKIDNDLATVVGIYNIINDRKFIIGDNCGKLYLYKY